MDIFSKRRKYIYGVNVYQSRLKMGEYLGNKIKKNVLILMI